MAALLRRTAERFPDARAAASLDYPIADAALAAFACFFFQDPSLLAFQRRMQDGQARSNLQTLFGVDAVPSDSQLREILDGAPVEPLRRLLGQLFERVRRSGWAVDFKTSPALGGDGRGLYPVILDATDYFSSSKISCAQCLTSTSTSTDGKTTTHYRHQILCATLFQSRTHRVLPLDAEPVRTSDGARKQDCELNAAKRLLARLRREHPKLPVVILGDAIYAHEPFLGDLREVAMSYLLVVKPGSQPETFDWVDDLEARGDWVEHGTWTEGPAAKRRFFSYRICREVPISQERGQWATLVEVWERTKEGRQVYHNSWITDLEVRAETIDEVVWLGRGRWKIENEQFNTHKNGGYHLEHNFGHGERTLSTVFYFLNLLAFVVHRILERSDRGYQGLRARMPAREVWEGLRFCFRRFLVADWDALIRSYDGDASGASP